MKVLSLFDGMSCGMLAFQCADVQVDRYVAYKCLGNGWTIEVIAHLIEGVMKELKE